jgi:hypothetical protein
MVAEAGYERRLPEDAVYRIAQCAGAYTVYDEHCVLACCQGGIKLALDQAELCG